MLYFLRIFEFAYYSHEFYAIDTLPDIRNFIRHSNMGRASWIRILSHYLIII